MLLLIFLAIFALSVWLERPGHRTLGRAVRDGFYRAVLTCFLLMVPGGFLLVLWSWGCFSEG